MAYYFNIFILIILISDNCFCMKFSRYNSSRFLWNRESVTKSQIQNTKCFQDCFSRLAWFWKNQGTTERYFYLYWRWGDSNPWPPACKAGALPTELHPHFPLDDLGLSSFVGLRRLELPTSRLSGVRSNRLSYKPSGSGLLVLKPFWVILIWF